jgi:hypothetical protein
MIKHEILKPEGILIVEPLSALAAEDFQALTSEVNEHLAGHPDLRGILIHARAFPGWDSFAALSPICALSATSTPGSSASRLPPTAPSRPSGQPSQSTSSGRNSDTFPMLSTTKPCNG